MRFVQRALWQPDQQIITPTIYRGNYLAALKAASNGNSPALLVRTVDFAQLFSLPVDWTSFARAEAKQAKAFMDSTEADERGIRLRHRPPVLDRHCDLNLFPNVTRYVETGNFSACRGEAHICENPLDVCGRSPVGETVRSLGVWAQGPSAGCEEGEKPCFSTQSLHISPQSQI